MSVGLFDNWPPEGAPFPKHSMTHNCHQMRVGDTVFAFTPSPNGPKRLREETVVAVRRWWITTAGGRRWNHNGDRISWPEFKANWITHPPEHWPEVIVRTRPKYLDKVSGKWVDY